MSVQQVDLILNGLRDTSGNPLAGGKVYTYVAGTTTNKTTYTDSAGTLSATNPVILDAYGRAQIYAEGSYKFLVKTSADETLYTWDNLYYSRANSATNPSPDYYGGSATGSSNTYAVTIPLTLSSLSAGQQVTFIANHTNTGASTLNVNGLGAIAIKNRNAEALSAGAIVNGQTINAVYAGGVWVIVSVTSDQNPNREVYGTCAGSSNAYTLTVATGQNAYYTGQIFSFIANHTNTAAPTLNVNSLGAKNILHNIVGVSLQGGEIPNGQLVKVQYDGTQFRLISPTSPAIYRVPAVSTIVSSTSETTLFTFSVPANLIGPFRSLRLTVYGDVLNTTGSQLDVTWRVKFGGTTVYSLPLIGLSGVANAVNKGSWRIVHTIEGLLSNAQTHVTEALTAQSTSDAGVGGGFDHSFAGYSSGGVDSTTANTLVVTGQLGTSSASAALRILGGLLEVL